MTAPPAGPRYAEASIADVLPSVLAALGVGTANPAIRLPEVPRTCLLLIDGMGFHLLHQHADLAPTLVELARPEPLDAAVPTTTATNLASLSTGLPPGEHGLLGATVALPDDDRPMSLLRWKLAGVGSEVSLEETQPPERFQPRPTLLERAAGAGLEPVTVGPRDHAGSGLQRATLRGGTHVGADSPAELIHAVPDLLRERERRLVYAYHGALDLAGHVHGIDSDEWREELAAADGLVAALAARLPAGASLVVIADHGMVDVAEDDQIEVADTPDLLDGVRVLAGEPRLRHVHTHDERSARDVLGRWQQELADRCWVLGRDDAVGAGWFGDDVTDTARSRIGDVVIAARAPVAIVQKAVDPHQRELVGHHGSLTDAERHIPFALATRL